MFQKDKGNFSCGRKLMLQSSLVHFAPWLLPMKWSQSFFKVPFEFLPLRQNRIFSHIPFTKNANSGKISSNPRLQYFNYNFNRAMAPLGSKEAYKTLRHCKVHISR